MKQETQVAVARRIFDCLDRRATERGEGIFFNEVSSYTSPEHLRRESAILFREYPLAVALSCEASAPGDQLVHDDTGIPIVVVRMQDGRLTGC